MHLFLAFLHFVMMAMVPEGAQVFRLVLQIVGVVAQVMNLCIISTLYSKSPPMELLDTKQIAFEGWLFVESYMIAFITVANTIFLFYRSIDRGRLNLEIGDENFDVKEDYLSCEETELIINLWGTIVSFIGTSILLLNSSTLYEATSEASRGNMWFQLIL